MSSQPQHPTEPRGTSARLARLALALYPLSFKRRYGDEIEALLEQSPPTVTTAVNLLRGAAAAHLRPRAAAEATIGAGDRARASASGVLAAWVLFAIAGAGYAKTTEDGPFSTIGYAHPLLGDVHQIVQVVAILASVVVVLAALPLIAAALHQAREGGSFWRLIVRPLAPVAVFVVLTAIFVAIAHTTPNTGNGTTGGHVAGILWMLAGLGCAGWCVAACRASLFASAAPPRRLLAALAGSALVAAAMVAITIAVAIYAIALASDASRLGAEGNGPFQLLSVNASLIIQVIVMAIASALAVTAARRGWRARTGLAA